MQIQLSARHYKNSMSYIMIYAIIGMMSGLIFDVMLTYLLSVSPDTANSIASYMGLSTFAASSIAILAPKTGFKRIMLLAIIVTAFSLLLISSAQSQWLISLGVFLVITGTALFDVMLSPFIAAHTTERNRADFFTKASFSSVLGIILGTSIGGPSLVWLFSNKLNISYSEGMTLTKNLGTLSFEQYSYYVSSHRVILILFAAISLLMIIPTFRIKEIAEDYKAEISSESNKNVSFLMLVNKYIILFMLYSVLSRFAASLIMPQLPIYLTDIGINRVNISILGTLQYFAILIFIVFSAKIVKKFGQVYTIAALCLSSVPFMIILANGYHYGSNVELFVGAALFFRAGLVNAATPVINSLTMELVSKNYRSLFSSLLFAMHSLSQIAAGLFAKNYLLNQDFGYAYAYYYAAGIYIIVNGILLIFFTRKYNHSLAEMT